MAAGPGLLSSVASLLLPFPLRTVVALASSCCDALPLGPEGTGVRLNCVNSGSGSYKEPIVPRPLFSHLYMEQQHQPHVRLDWNIHSRCLNAT